MTAITVQCVHATTVSLNGTAVLIRGASGAGKSDLALQLLETSGSGLSGQPLHAALVADDQTELRLVGDEILASSPVALRGLLEVRGQGLLAVACVADVPLVLVVDLEPASGIERMPETHEMVTNILGKDVPTVSIDPASASAASRLRTAWVHVSRFDKSP